MCLLAFHFLLAKPVELSLAFQCSSDASPLPLLTLLSYSTSAICTNRNRNDTSKLIFIPQQDLNSTLQG